MKRNTVSPGLYVRFIGMLMLIAGLCFFNACDDILVTPVTPPVTSPVPPEEPETLQDVFRDGPFDTAQNLRGGPNGNSGVFYPTDLGRDGFKHPIFLWGCGGSSTPSQYVDHMNRIASHGFVIVAEVSRVNGNGRVLAASLEWIIRQNDTPQSRFYQKLDTHRIAVGGHSIGSVNAFAIADDQRLKTSVHVAGGSLDNQGAEARKLVHPTIYICGESDMFGNVEKAEADYRVTNVPVFFTIIDRANHMNAAREGLPAIVAWLRWHVLDEDGYSSMFLDSDGAFQTGKFNSRIKNW